MKRLKNISTIVVSLIIINGCGSTTEENKSSLNFDENMTKSSITKQILENKGLYNFQLFDQHRLGLAISHIKLNNDELIRNNSFYSLKGGIFREETEENIISITTSPIITYYNLTDNGWELSTKDLNQIDNTITFNNNGYFSKEANTSILSIKKLEGLSIQSESNNTFLAIPNVKNYISENSTFSKDTILVKSKTEYLMESNFTIADKICFSTEGEMMCHEDLATKFYDSNSVSSPINSPTPIPPNSPTKEATIVETIESISFYSIDEFLLYFKKGGEHFLGGNRYSSQFDDNNTIYYFDASNNHVQQTAMGKLEKQIVNSITFYEMQMPKEYQTIVQPQYYMKEGEANTILVDDFNGKLVHGIWKKSNNFSVVTRYNNNAINDIKKAIEEFMENKDSDSDSNTIP